MISTTPPATSSQPLQRIAPVRHTIVVVAVLLIVTAFCALALARTAGSSLAPSPPTNLVSLYLSLIVAEWALFYLVMSGLRSGTKSWRDVIAGPWTHLHQPLRDLLIALGFWALWTAFLLPVRSWLAAGDTRYLASLLPRTLPEILVWVALSLTAGFCEEFIYRGYLQQQFAAFLGGPLWGLLLQAALFGVSHAYQGGRRVLMISFYGLLFGLLAQWRRSLRPGMMAHAWTDIVGGLVFPSS